MDELAKVFFTLIQFIFILGLFGGAIYLFMLFAKIMPTPEPIKKTNKPDSINTIKEAINRAEHDDKSFLYYFGSAIGSGFKNYFNFEGRSSRRQFWYFALFALIAMFIAGSVQEIYYHNTSRMSHPIPIIAVLTSEGPIPLLTGLFIFIPYLSVSVRRLHDIGKSGWWLLLSITGIGNILLIIWWATKSSSEKKYGNKITEKPNKEISSANKLRELNQLYKEGVITKKEFTEAKKKYLK